MQEDFTQNRLHPGISMRFETCEVWERVQLYSQYTPLGGTAWILREDEQLVKERMAMAQIFNQYSYLFVALIVLVVVAFVLPRVLAPRSAWVLLLGMAVGLGAVWFLVRPDRGSLASADDIRAQIGAGTPVLLEFQSPF